METQWPLVIFTLGICLSCGLLGATSILALRNAAEKIQMPALITAFLSLVIGGVGSFLHLQHWERAFNGFGNITSGITQELIGCAVLVLVMLVWLVMLVRKKAPSGALAWVTIIVAMAVVCVTAHSYLMPARPAWGVSLIAFYLGNACILGPAVLWCIAAVVKDEAIAPSVIRMSLIGVILQLAADAVFLAACAGAKVANFGSYLDPTRMTTAPTHIDNLAAFVLSGGGAPFFWGSIACVLVMLICAVVAQRSMGTFRGLAIVAVLVAGATSVLFRVLIYLAGYPVLLLY
jgi:anaerobic dimethyl sulfoxide reductase subunit C (anchor subunit)